MLLSLIPGLPDDVVLNHILTKVSWKYSFVLSALNTRWREEFRSRRVYEHRHRRGRAEQLIAVIHENPEHLHHAEPPRSVLSVFNLPGGDAWLRLPGIPGIKRGVPQGCGFVFLEGKLYILGGSDYSTHYKAGSSHGDDHHEDFSPSLVPKCTVYELDVAGGRGLWKVAAGMGRPRVNFTCKVHEGRIHVTEYYIKNGVPTWETDVYDPLSNTWTPRVSGFLEHAYSPARPPSNSKESMLENFLGVRQDMELRIDTLKSLVYLLAPGGQWLDYDYIDLLIRQSRCREGGIWPRPSLSNNCSMSARVRMNGKLYSVSAVGVSFWDSAAGEWHWQSRSFWDYLKRVGGQDIQCWCAVPVDGELLVVVSWIVWLSSEKVFALIMSKGLSSKDQSITWDKVSFSDHFSWSRPRQTENGLQSSTSTNDHSYSHLFSRCPPRVCASKA